jgi:hypothetical protein
MDNNSPFLHFLIVNWKIMRYSGQVFLLLKKRGYSPNQLLYPLDQRETGENVLETYKTICYLFLLL